MTYEHDFDALVREFRLTTDGDIWGNVLGWMFRIADSLTFHHEEAVPAEWQFRPSPMGRGDDPEEDDVAAMLDETDPADLVLFGGVLELAREVLVAQGKDY